jgi:hypothetical protein
MKWILLIIFITLAIICVIIANNSRNPYFRSVGGSLLIVSSICISLTIVYIIWTSELPVWLKIWLLR